MYFEIYPLLEGNTEELNFYIQFLRMIYKGITDQEHGAAEVWKPKNHPLRVGNRTHTQFWCTHLLPSFTIFPGPVQVVSHKRCHLYGAPIEQVKDNIYGHTNSIQLLCYE